MDRLEKILAHLKAKGTGYVHAYHRIVANRFTEHQFGHVTPRVHVREWDNGQIEILFVSGSLSAGLSRDPFQKVPDMNWVLEMVDKDTKPLPPIPEAS